MLVNEFASFSGLICGNDMPERAEFSRPWLRLELEKVLFLVHNAHLPCGLLRQLDAGKVHHDRHTASCFCSFKKVHRSSALDYCCPGNIYKKRLQRIVTNKSSFSWWMHVLQAF